jgi:hypothetical protein
MEEFIHNFVREADGSWLCVRPAETVLPGGRIQVTPGARFVDLADLLEAQYRRRDGA